MLKITKAASKAAKGSDYLGEQVLKVLLNISSFAGTLLGLAGLIVGAISLKITIKTFKKTEEIAEAVDNAIEKERMRITYPSKHKAFKDAVEKVMVSYIEGERNPIVINDLLNTGTTMKAFYISWKVESKQELDNFLNFLNSLDLSNNLDDSTSEKLYKKLCAIKATLEKESALQ